MKIRFLNIIFSLLTGLVIALCPLLSHADSDNTVNQIVFFGDSLSDNGNLYSDNFGHMPKSPPYFQGRFSNGYLWSDVVANHYLDTASVTSANYAIGGESALLHNPLGEGYFPIFLTGSIDSYLLHTILRDRSHTLFIIWIGANDYLPGTTDNETLTTAVVANISKSIESLISHGGKNFLIINLPDLSKTPYSANNNEDEMLHTLSTMHNAKLSLAITALQDEYKTVNIHLFDMGGLLTDFLTHIDAYNTQYQIHITQTNKSCWLGGYTLAAHHANTIEESISREFNEQIKRHTSINVTLNAARKPIDTDNYANYITSSPALLESYKVTQLADEGGLPCQNPEEYFFWDQVHPTTLVHMMIADKMIGFMNSYYSLPPHIPANG